MTDPTDLSNRLAVGCSEIVPTPIAVIAIVATPPTTPPTTVPDGAAVLADNAAAAQAVETTPAVTG